MANDKIRIIGIGELLWDLFPTGSRLGGAPFNFCYHCIQLGAQGIPVSAIGKDALGREIRNVFVSKKIPDVYVAEIQNLPTGTVKVSLENGKPSYEICEGVAWDVLPMSEKLKDLARKADAVCFGSLAQRNAVSRTTIRQFLEMMRAESLKIFDVNLRQAFFTADLIAESLEHCNILKLSDEELPLLADMFGFNGPVEEQLCMLAEKFDLKLIAYTRGPDGSVLVAPDEISNHPGCAGSAINSVGAGDSFTATMCVGLLNGTTLDEINEHANRVATFVCSQDGATPVLPAELINGGVYASP